MSHSIDQFASTHEKIAVFRSLFRGRDDVYPRRFESRTTGRAGYAPACAHEWVRGICEKPRIKCADCTVRRFLPVTDDVVRWHLLGRDDAGQPFVAGVYPLLPDETCHFLAVDFDKGDWRDDALAFARGCRARSLQAAIERSRSGLGAHVWVFFEDALPAALARRLGAHLLTEAMDVHPTLGFGSYDRLFPNQDTLPQGGFGNLIALPLQREARAQDNTVFVDDAWEPLPDQWAYLSSLRRTPRREVEAIVQDAERRGRIVGVRLPRTTRTIALQAATRPFAHVVHVHTTFLAGSALDADRRVAFQTLYKALIDDERRTERISDDVVDAVRAGQSPLVLTERNDTSSGSSAPSPRACRTSSCCVPDSGRNSARCSRHGSRDP